MANNIANVSIPAPVVQFKNDLYLVEGQFSYRTLNIPCGINALVEDEQHWFVPVKDSGICTTCSIVPAIGNYPPSNPPTPDSLLVLRVRDKYNRDYVWWVICTIAQYYASCQTCCGVAFVPIPPPVLPVIVPCQEVCSLNAAGEFISIFGYPVDSGNYHAYGELNNVALPKQTAATIAALVILLNANVNWTDNGAFIWTASGGVLQAEGGHDGDILCVLITSDNSP